MEVLSHNSEGFNPGILLDKESGNFQLYGTSCPQNAFEFYNPVFEWFDEYIENPLKETILDLNFSYFNTVTGKLLIRLLTKLSKLNETGNDVLVRWHYSEDDYDMKEEGEEFENIINLKFEMVEVKEDDE